MDANEYKNYLLGIIFYKYLSDKMLYYVGQLIGDPNADLKTNQKLYEENAEDEEAAEFNVPEENSETYEDEDN